MIEYRRERTVFTEEQHDLANELTEAINSYINETQGDELRESLDVGIAVARMLVGQEDRKKALANVANAGAAAGLNAMNAQFEKVD